MKPTLYEKACALFGSEHAEELRPDLDKVAAELAALETFPLTIDNES